MVPEYQTEADRRTMCWTTLSNLFRVEWEVHSRVDLWEPLVIRYVLRSEGGKKAAQGESGDSWCRKHHISTTSCYHLWLSSSSLENKNNFLVFGHCNLGATSSVIEGILTYFSDAPLGSIDESDCLFCSLGWRSHDSNWLVLTVFADWIGYCRCLLCTIRSAKPIRGRAFVKQ